MRTSAQTVPFLKTAACPASKTLLASRGKTLSKKAAKQISEHLESCDFCNAERQLLAHHTPGRKGFKTPEIPINLRILAEAILAKR